MKYSEVLITDDNFDDEFESYCKAVDVPQDCSYEFYTELPSGFTENPPNKDYNFTTYVKSKILPNHSSSVTSPISCGEFAAEFGNGYMSVEFKEAL